MNYVWEQRKFSELYKKVNEKNIFRFGVDKIISVANMYFKEDVKKPNDEYMRTYNIMRLGDIAFEGNKSKNFSHGRFVENTIGDGIVSHVFDVFRPVMDYDLLFWKYLINNENVMGRIMTRCTKASTMMTNLVAKDFLNENILVPTIEEQHKIGTYIDKLDHLITLHQRKIYIFIKIMPIDWEQRKLGDVLSLLKDGTHGTHRDAESGPLLLSAKNIKNGTVQWDESDRRISEDEYNIIHSNFRLQKGDVLLTIVGSIGEVAILSQSEGVTFQRSVAFLRPSDEICSEFLYSEIQGQKFQKELNDRKSTSAQPGMYLGDLGAIPIEFPTSDEEQMQIGSYFSTIDHLITLHHHEEFCTENVLIYIEINKTIQIKEDIMAELESVIEQKLIDQLVYGDSQWTYRADLKTEEDLWNNFRYILVQNNKDRLNGEPLSDTEFEQVKNQLQFSSFYKAGEWLVGENGKVMVHVQRNES